MTAPSRRDFVELACLGACGLALAPALGGCAALPSLAAEPQGDRLVLALADVEAALDGAPGVYLEVPGVWNGLLLLRTGPGPAGEPDDTGFRALWAACTHLGCRVRPTGEALVCPCHGSTFANDGTVLRGPAGRPLEVYPVAVAGDQLAIALNPSSR